MDDGCGCDDVRPGSAHLGFARSDMSRRASPHATCRLPPKKRKVRPRAFGIDLRLLLAGARSSRAEVTKRPSVSGSVSRVFLFHHTAGNSAPPLSTNRARRLHNLPARVEFFDRRRLGRATRGAQTVLSGFVRLSHFPRTPQSFVSCAFLLRFSASHRLRRVPSARASRLARERDARTEAWTRAPALSAHSDTRASPRHTAR